MKTQEHARRSAEKVNQEAQALAKERERQHLEQSFVELQGGQVPLEEVERQDRMSAMEKMMWEEYDMFGAQLPFSAGDDPNAEINATRAALQRDCDNLILQDPADAARQLGLGAENLDDAGDREAQEYDNSEEALLSELFAKACTWTS